LDAKRRPDLALARFAGNLASPDLPALSESSACSNSASRRQIVCCTVQRCCAGERPECPVAGQPAITMTPSMASARSSEARAKSVMPAAEERHAPNLSTASPPKIQNNEYGRSRQVSVDDPFASFARATCSRGHPYRRNLAGAESFCLERGEVIRDASKSAGRASTGGRLSLRRACPSAAYGAMAEEIRHV
jgi:hypothetical protein